MEVKHYQVKVTVQAEQQMREIAIYIAAELRNPTAAVNLLDEFGEMMDSLEEHPQRIALVREEPWRSEGIRMAIVKNHLLYFWIDEQNAKVQVTAAVCAGRDQRRALEEMKKE